MFTVDVVHTTAVGWPRRRKGSTSTGAEREGDVSFFLFLSFPPSSQFPLSGFGRSRQPGTSSLQSRSRSQGVVDTVTVSTPSFYYSGRKKKRRATFPQQRFRHLLLQPPRLRISIVIEVGVFILTYNMKRRYKKEPVSFGSASQDGGRTTRNGWLRILSLAKRNKRRWDFVVTCHAFHMMLSLQVCRERRKKQMPLVCDVFPKEGNPIPSPPSLFALHSRLAKCDAAVAIVAGPCLVGKLRRLKTSTAGQSLLSRKCYV